jgi:hypothetical protein
MWLMRPSFSMMPSFSLAALMLPGALAAAMVRVHPLAADKGTPPSLGHVNPWHVCR